MFNYIKVTRFTQLTGLLVLLAFSANVLAESAIPRPDCSGLPSHSVLVQVLKDNVAASGGPSNGGLDNHMWATLVNRDGAVCAVAFSGSDRTSQWYGSRVISAQKAYTGNAFSLGNSAAGGTIIALSTANLYSAVQPGGSLFGLQHSNPVDPSVAYGLDHSRGRAEVRAVKRYGTRRDPLIGDISGGINVFGGGLALYNEAGDAIGALGVSGDTSCADHNVAWRVREAFGLDNVPGGVSAAGDDGIDYLAEGEAPNGFQHPQCGFGEVGVAESIGAGAI